MTDNAGEPLEETVGFELPIQRRVLLETADFPTELRSRYTLTRVQGQGGLGQVWLAIDGTLRREVALKEVRPDRDSDQETIKRLLKEAQITGQLEHPNIVPVYELAQGENQKPFYTMRFLRGQPLDRRVKEYHAKRATDRTMHSNCGSCSRSFPASARRWPTPTRAGSCIGISSLKM